MTTIEPIWTQQQTRPLGWWGMLLAVATEGTLFATLIASYFYIRFKTVAWPPDGIANPHVLLPCVLTGVLVASSVPMVIAERALRRSRPRLLRTSLFTAFLLGVAYTLLQFRQYENDWGKFKPSRDAYGSLYYTLTGLHWAHVVAGLLLLLFVQYQVWQRAYRPERSAGVQVAALYVHFVNVLALAILLTVYLSPRL